MPCEYFVQHDISINKMNAIKRSNITIDANSLKFYPSVLLKLKILIPEKRNEKW